ncbi:MAG TPA: DUF3551 domain-containing protein [Pseudolabrys sp.]|nr:DUF3551 domain-containing protein [Pseudolabrys sp.]
MLRIILAIGVLAAIQLANPGQARAGEGPWCALLNFGSDLSEDCQYRSLEECRLTIISGFRGFCNPNPRWQADVVKGRPRRQS